MELIELPRKTILPERCGLFPAVVPDDQTRWESPAEFREGEPKDESPFQQSDNSEKPDFYLGGLIFSVPFGGSPFSLVSRGGGV